MEFNKIKEQADDQYRLIREMSVDNSQILPNEKTRHWMVAQTHIMFEEGKEEHLQDGINVRNKVENRNVKFNNPTDVERSRAKAAYDSISENIFKLDLNSDNLFEDLLSEKSYQLDRFA